MDWAQLWEIVSLPDNIPIVFLLVLLPFFLWYGLRQAFANDRLISRLEVDSELAKKHHRKIEPFREGWDLKVYVWPYLLRIEFLAAVIVTFVLMVCSYAHANHHGTDSDSLYRQKSTWKWLLYI